MQITSKVLDVQSIWKQTLPCHEKSWQVPSDKPSKIDRLSPTIEVAAAADCTAMLC